MTHIVIPDSDLLEVVDKEVNDNGQIYVGRKHGGKVIRAYIVKME